MKRTLLVLFSAYFLSSCQFFAMEQIEDRYVSSSKEPTFYWRDNTEEAPKITQAIAMVDPLEREIYVDKKRKVLELVSAKVNQRLAARELTITPYQYPLFMTGFSHLEAYSLIEERGFILTDLPLVYFGGFRPSGSYEEIEPMQNVLTITNGSPKWRSSYLVTHESKPSLYIYVGFIQATGQNVDGNKVLQIAEDKFIEINNRAYLEKPINVIALKAVQLNEQGVPIATAVHGIIPLWPHNTEFNILNGDVLSEESLLKFIGSFNQYDIDGATDSVLSILGFNDAAHQP